MKAKKDSFISEEEKLKIHLERSYTERFRILMELIRLSKKIKEAKIIEAKSQLVDTLDNEILELWRLLNLHGTE